ncbi:MAG: phosphonate ABC transporter ATP-binding protein [Nitrososphaerota archaeon]
MIKIEALNVTYPYPSNVKALENINLSIDEGEFVVIAGISGSGKSTLLRCINRLAENDKAVISGKILFNGVDVLKVSKRELRAIRAQIGFVFQEYNLVDRLPIITNALVGRLSYLNTLAAIFRRFRPEDINFAHEVLVRVGLDFNRHKDRASNLSGGQKQRVGIARVLLQKPKLILADEPVASLDPITANRVMNLFKRINEDQKITTIISLHDPVLTFKYGKRIIGLKQGRIIYDKSIEMINRETFEEEIYGKINDS